MKGKTKDEKFIVCAFETASAKGDFYTTVDRYEIGNKIGITTKTVDTICRLLAQANFIKFGAENDIRLTPNGKNLAESLL